MQHNSIMEHEDGQLNYEGIRLSINNFHKTRNPEVDALLDEYVRARAIISKTDRIKLAMKIVKKMEKMPCRKQ